MPIFSSSNDNDIAGNTFFKSVQNLLKEKTHTILPRKKKEGINKEVCSVTG